MERSSRSGRLYHAKEDDAAVPSEMSLNLEMGKSDSLWSQAEDFWHAVGWAFNCSVLHPERWERWQVWLAYMVDIMEDDWLAREKKYRKAEAKKKHEESKENGEESAEETKPSIKQGGDDGLEIFRESLIFQYIISGASGSDSGRNRRIIRAIFADGSTKPANEFRQVFRMELASKSKKKDAEKPKKREREVNIDEGEYGDYLAQDETDDELNGTADSSHNPSRASSPTTGTTRRSKRTRRGTRTGPNAVTSQTAEASLPHNRVGLASMGGLAALGLRKNLLGLLSEVSERLPRDFIQWYDLYDLFVDFIRPLPLPIFQALVNPYVLRGISDAAQTTLCEKLLLSFREQRAPTSQEEYLSQAKLEECYLPYAAASSSAVNNAKISLLLEAVIQLLADSDMLSMTPDFRQAIGMGIETRADRAQDEVRRNQTSRDKEPIEWCWLLESGERLMFLTEILSDQET